MSARSLGPPIRWVGLALLSFSAVLMTTPGSAQESTISPEASALLKKAAGLASGSGLPHKNKVAKLTKAQVMEVVKAKRPDLNSKSDEAAFRVIAGTARQMGIEIEG